MPLREQLADPGVSDMLGGAGVAIEDLRDDFGVPLGQLDDVLRVASRRSA